MKKSTCIASTVCLCLLGIVSITALSLLTTFFNWMVLRNIRLDNPHSVVYQQWLRPTVPIYLQFYFLNLTNPLEFQNGSKPRVTERGPYTYREQRFKTGVMINLENGTVHYREVKQYYFVRSLSVGPETDKITTVNLVYLSISQRLNTLPQFVTRLIELFEKVLGEQLCIQRSVSEILWGYEDPLLKFLKHFFGSIPTTRIGLYLDRNNSDGGVEFAIDGGFRQSTDFGRIMLYNGSKSLSCWTTDQANQINGTDGSLFHPFLRSDEGLYVFASDICRSIYFTPRTKVLVQGINTVKYLPLEDTFDSPLNCSKNRGFCIHWPYCAKTGILDMSTCQPDAPIVISMPHLVNADKSYRDAVEGLHPSDEFNTTFHIEPISGTVIQAAKKLQINANVSRNLKFSSMSKIIDVFLPIVYVNESVLVDDRTAREIRNSIYFLPRVLYVAFGAVLLFALTGLLFLCMTVTCGFNSSVAVETANETTPLLVDDRQCNTITH